MKKNLVSLFIASVSILIIFQLVVVSSLFSGSWCPYQITKSIPCKIRNGNESYLGPNICWKSLNGSLSCTKRVLYRPKFVTTVKKISETRYKCCPGLNGDNCQTECFNCSSFDILQKQVQNLETKLNQIEDNSIAKHLYHDPYFTSTQNYGHRQSVFEVDNSIREENENIKSTVAVLLSDMRNLELRLSSVESELTRMSSAMREIIRNSNDVSRGLYHTVESFTELEPLQQKQQQQSTTQQQRFHQTRTTTETTTITPTTVTTRKKKLHRHFSRAYEDNLDRGDIASTINDDYDEEEDDDISNEEEEEEEEEYDADQDNNNKFFTNNDDDYVDQLYNNV